MDSEVCFQNYIISFGYFDPVNVFSNTKKYIRGDLSNISAKTATLVFDATG